MFGIGYTGKYYYGTMPEIFVKEKFAWKPILTTSGKWVWWRSYFKKTLVYWGPAGESPVIDAEYFTKSEFLLEQIKDPSLVLNKKLERPDTGSRRPNPPTPTKPRPTTGSGIARYY